MGRCEAFLLRQRKLLVIAFCGLIAVTVLAIFFDFWWCSNDAIGLRFGVESGSVVFGCWDPKSVAFYVNPQGLHLQVRDRSWDWLPYSEGPFTRLSFPLAAPLGVSAMAAFLPRKVVCPLKCGKCGYDLAGNQTAVCPECGNNAESGPTADKQS